jgi:hypothetical protein
MQSFPLIDDELIPSNELIKCAPCNPCPKPCREIGCKNKIRFNFKNMTKSHFCKEHKTENMVDVYSKICEKSDCFIMACYNFPGNDKNPIYCKSHGKEGMVDVLSKHCIEENCYKRANFNNKNDKNPLYCATHKEPEMIDVKSKRCIEKDCNTRPNYNYKDKKKPIYCKEHKLEGMVDICHKKCEFETCNIRPIYNFENETVAIFCKRHAEEGMIDVTCNRCDFDSCNDRAYYNYVNENLPRFCKLHRHLDMEDKTHKECLTPLCDVIVNHQRNRGYCVYCFSRMFPDEQNSRNYKTKEQLVVESVIKAFPDLSWITDRRVDLGCSRRRPDLFLDLGSHVLIIEIDENQHNGYEKICDSKRIMEISQDIQHRPLVCIRFNPDGYYDGSTKHKSCWDIDAKGMCYLKNIIDWNMRIDKLLNLTNYHLNIVCEKTIHHEYLFYDKDKT